MRENQTISEDIIVRRVQRRLERYFSDLEKPKTNNETDVFEASGTKIVTLSTEPKLSQPANVVSEKILPPIAPPPPVERKPLPPLPAMKKEPTSGFSTDFPTAFNETKTEQFAPSKTTKTQPPNLPSISSPIFGESNSAKIAPLSEAPTLETSKEATPDAKNSLLPLFMFFLAFVAAGGLLLAWYWFTGGPAEPTLPR